MRLSLVPLFAAALWVAGCSDQNGPIGPMEQPSVQGPSQSLSLGADLDAIMRGETPDLSARTVSKVIGPEGGYIYVDLHYLYVPKGAVAKPTLFRMELPADGTIGADLTATTVGSLTINNVGKAGFKVPVYLTFSYGYVKNAPANPSLLRIMWKKPDGTYVVQPTYVNRQYKIATGTLKHFSDYVLGTP
jgi:hypothetical protein